MLRVVSPVMNPVFKYNKHMRTFLFVLLAPLGYGGLFLASSFPVWPFLAVAGPTPSRTWLVWLVGIISAIAFLLFFVMLFQIFSRELRAGVCSIDRIVVLVGSVFWVILVSVLYML